MVWLVSGDGLVVHMFFHLRFRMYFKVKPDRKLVWSLTEESADGTGMLAVVQLDAINPTFYLW